MMATILWAAFFTLMALFLLAVIVKGITRLLRGRPAGTEHPYRQAAREDERQPPEAGRGG